MRAHTHHFLSPTPPPPPPTKPSQTHHNNKNIIVFPTHPFTQNLMTKQIMGLRSFVPSSLPPPRCKKISAIFLAMTCVLTVGSAATQLRGVSFSLLSFSPPLFSSFSPNARARSVAGSSASVSAPSQHNLTHKHTHTHSLREQEHGN